MTVTLNDDEIKEAIVEWCQRRGISATMKHTVQLGGPPSKPTITIHGVTPVVTPKEGPYR